MGANHLFLDANPAALAEFELHLQSSLQPVKPDPEFVYTLKRKLVSPDTVVLERESKAFSLLLIAFGLLSGVLLLMVGRRLYTWFIK